jgi:hypothetical protein
MWPFSEMSLAAASLVGTIANWLLLASLIGGVLSTFVIVKTSDVKEEHWAEDRRISNERIAELTAQAEEARKETAQAKLELQQIRFPRSINLEKFQERIAKLPLTPFEVLYDANAPDAAFLAEVIWSGLANLKWPSTQMAGPKPLGPPPPNLIPWSNLPWTLVNLLRIDGHL